MSMLRYFFEDTGNDGENRAYRKLFDGLRIMEESSRYLSQCGKYPVISLSLRLASPYSWELALMMVEDKLAAEFDRHSYVLESMDSSSKRHFQTIWERKGGVDDYIGAVAFLSKCLERYHHRKVIILFDEYDVPFDKAYSHGFYRQMEDFIRALFEATLKDNPSLHFAVVTGCLGSAEHPIFAGLEGLRINSILSEDYGEYFGFTPKETETLFYSYGREAALPTAYSWYGGLSVWG